VTTRPYIWTVSEVNAEWCAPHLQPACPHVLIVFVRLIEYAGNYFDLSTFYNGETKRALQRAWNKRAGKEDGYEKGNKARKLQDGNGRPEKKRKY